MTISTDLTAQPAEAAGGSRRSGDPLVASYGRTFWLAYLANFLFMMAITLLYRYADFVTFLRGTELDLGWIVGIGMTGSLLMRFVQGRWIDRYGARKVWLASGTAFVASLLGHLLITRVNTPPIYLLRIAFSVSMAGTFGASITYVSRSMPIARMAEVVGTLGTSGFLAMPLGPAIGDWICRTHTLSRDRLNWMFLVAAAFGVCSLVCAALASQGEVFRPRRRRPPPVLWILSRYHPGPVLLIGAAFGIGTSLPTVFLTTFAEQRHIPRIAGFFVFYALTAFITRMLSRNFPHRFGVRPMIYWGLASMIVSILCYVVVTNVWELVLPGFFGGVAHAFLFPAVVASGSGEFPNRYRGLGTVVVLAMVDLGNVIGAPMVGLLLYYARALGWPPYTTMFVVVAIILSAAGIYYTLRSWLLDRQTEPGPAAA